MAALLYSGGKPSRTPRPVRKGRALLPGRGISDLENREFPRIVVQRDPNHIQRFEPVLSFDHQNAIRRNSED
jgi:hypothetical protein